MDHFKRYNDYYGHLAGDDCLRTVAKALASGWARVTGRSLWRRGFVVLLERIGPAAALDVAETILQRVRDLRIPHQGRQDDKTQVTVSIGIARSGLAGLSTAEDLLDCADRALYRAKRDGRDRVFEGGIDAILGAPLDHAELLTPKMSARGWWQRIPAALPAHLPRSSPGR